MLLPQSDRHFSSIGEGTYQIKAIHKAVELTPGRSLAIDVGAHVGYWSKEFTKYFDQVISIEPVKENFDCLVVNVPTAVHLFAACGERNKTVTLKNPSDGNSGAWEAGDGEESTCLTIDSLEVSPDLIKMDVQGYEKNVIDGALETISRCHPTLCVEVVMNGRENTDLIRYIESLGYVIGAVVGKDRVFVANLKEAA